MNAFEKLAEFLVKEIQDREQPAEEPQEAGKADFQITLRLLGYFVRILGFVVFGVALGLIIAFSVLQWGYINELTIYGIVGGVVLIGIGTIMQRA